MTNTNTPRGIWCCAITVINDPQYCEYGTSGWTPAEAIDEAMKLVPKGAEIVRMELTYGEDDGNDIFIKP